MSTEARSARVPGPEELLAAARIYLLDAGERTAQVMTPDEVLAAWDRLCAAAAELGRSPGKHAEILRDERRARTSSRVCSNCRHLRPPWGASRGWTALPDGSPLCAARVREAWMLAGRPDLGDGPIALVLDVVVARPGGHYRVNGDLNAAGHRAHRPTRTPDLDNVLKLVCDALNQCVYRDDRQIVTAQLERRWCEPAEREHVRVTLAAIPAPEYAVPERKATA